MNSIEGFTGFEPAGRVSPAAVSPNSAGLEKCAFKDSGAEPAPCLQTQETLAQWSSRQCPILF